MSYGWLGLTYVTGITFLCYYKFRVYAVWSTVEENSLKTKLYLKWILLFFAAYSVVQLIGFSLWYYIPFVISLYVSVLVKLLTTIGIFAIAYLNVQHAHQVAPVVMEMPAGPAEKYKFSKLDHETAQAIQLQLQQLVDTEKFYLQRDLKQKEVADKLATSVHHLSQVLNEHMGISFPDFVNQQRIEAAKKMLIAGDNSKIESIALDTGFNNKVSFNKAFKKFTGFTPSQYKMQLKEQREQAVGLSNV
ncbi:helix-turn-helix domain-containing protein [Paraflavitalea speifideaquila]|uniref:helix-turn-helix domain-containing protein n=1 Tax=Paraflavitalea speifideaquila TaxID=3076558 RepID=UPI0028F00715|nr:helix-turn-helix domain-containing protein [Paraflavitalea speifideiaquila]